MSSKIFLTDGSVFDYFFYNGTDVEMSFAKTTVNGMIFLLGFPIDSYVIWLIATGTGNGLAAEFFSLNLSICDMFFYMDCLLSSFRSKDDYVWRAASFFNTLALTGRPVFQLLICFERYLAVVHPVTFLKSKPLRYRLICCVVIWVATFVSGGINVMFSFISRFMSLYYIFIIMAHFSICFFIQLYFLGAVLRALKQSGPGERRREQENHMKRKAFYVILITTLSLLIILIFHLILISFAKDNLVAFVCVGYFGFALSGLVQPLLFLYRVEKMPFIKCQ